MSEQVEILVVVEDEPDMRALVRAQFSADPRLHVYGEAATAREAIEIARAGHPRLIVLDHAIEGDLMGLDAAPLLKEAAPGVKILLFTAFDLGQEAREDPSIDGFLPKSRIRDLLPTVRALLGLD